MKKVAIIGAGISGLFFGNLLRQDSDYEITIYEKSNSINLEKGYGIQLSVNSIELLNKIGFQSLNSFNKFNPKKIDFYSLLKKIKYVILIYLISIPRKQNTQHYKDLVCLSF